ncbi:unnamed protein product [marine sediment metagenome]|uniref:Uncharacterized protein n=1 Tax=marine sediment metagenome TaxID=412755 RepID=X0WKP4_9ZZZZ
MVNLNLREVDSLFVMVICHESQDIVELDENLTDYSGIPTFQDFFKSFSKGKKQH